MVIGIWDSNLLKWYLNVIQTLWVYLFILTWRVGRAGRNKIGLRILWLNFQMRPWSQKRWVACWITQLDSTECDQALSSELGVQNASCSSCCILLLLVSSPEMWTFCLVSLCIQMFGIWRGLNLEDNYRIF